MFSKSGRETASISSFFVAVNTIRSEISSWIRFSALELMKTSPNMSFYRFFEFVPLSLIRICAVLHLPPVCPFTCPFIRLFIHPFTRPFTGPFTRSRSQVRLGGRGAAATHQALRGYFEIFRDILNIDLKIEQKTRVFLKNGEIVRFHR